jgi:hypothetical protein
MEVNIKFKGDNFSRLVVVKVGNKELATPAYFPAISSLQHYDVKDLFDFLIEKKYGKMLLSLFDINKDERLHESKSLGEVSEYSRTGNFVIIDSGMFESYWKNDKTWTLKEYSDTLANIDADFYSTFDFLPNLLPKNINLYNLLIEGIGESHKVITSGTPLEIFHGRTPEELISNVGKYASSVENYKNKIIAIPERECGSSIIERGRNIMQITRKLREINEKFLLHILGCGNPISMSLYIYCGADTFDSIDWTSNIFEKNENKMFDFSQLDLIGCNCKACSAKDETYINRALLHNLLFYQQHLEKLQNMIKEGTIKDYVQVYLGTHLFKELG